MHYFYVTLGHKPYLSKDGEVTCDEKALKRLSRKGIVEAEILLHYRKLTKMYGTYFEMQFDEDGRFRCSYNPVGTEQGRISSSKNIFGTGGNGQNLPEEMRELMMAD
jgi:DNA polymerase I-like protein with 3'-5' exonuclease and polymerase domains